MLSIVLSLTLSLSTAYHGRATTFDHPSRDPWNTSGAVTHLACVAHGRTSDARVAELISREMIVAHKSMPCYSLVTVCVDRTMRCKLATVADWGPVHADIDLYAPLSRSLGHNGDEPVTWVRHSR